MPSLVSCVVPVRDGERYLAEAIDSVLAQDHRPLELLVIDDGSTDASAAIAAAYGAPVRVLSQAPTGIAAARNLGVEAAGGAFVCFLDADDRYRPGKLSSQLALLEARPELEGCLCMAENFWEPGLEQEERRYRELGKLRASHHVGNLLARRSLFERLGPMPTGSDAGSDIEWFLRVRDAGIELALLDEVHLDRRMHPASHSHRLAGLDPYLDLAKARIDRARGRG